MGFFEKLVAGLGKTRDNIVSGMDSIFHGFSRIDDDFYEELEAVQARACSLLWNHTGNSPVFPPPNHPCST